MNPSNLRKWRGAQGGAAFIELAIVVPLLLLLIFGGVEFANSLRVYARLTAITRELSLAEFRGCYGRLDHSVCLLEVANAIEANSSLTLPGVRLIASRWQYNSGTLSCEQLASVATGVTFSPPHAAYNVSQITVSVPGFSTTCQEQSLLYASEVAVVYRPIIPGIASLFGFTGGVYRAALLV